MKINPVSLRQSSLPLGGAVYRKRRTLSIFLDRLIFLNSIAEIINSEGALLYQTLFKTHVQKIEVIGNHIQAILVNRVSSDSGQAHLNFEHYFVIKPVFASGSEAIQ